MSATTASRLSGSGALARMCPVDGSAQLILVGPPIHTAPAAMEVVA